MSKGESKKQERAEHKGKGKRAADADTGMFPQLTVPKGKGGRMPCKGKGREEAVTVADHSTKGSEANWARLGTAVADARLVRRGCGGQSRHVYGAVCPGRLVPRVMCWR